MFEEEESDIMSGDSHFLLKAQALKDDQVARANSSMEATADFWVVHQDFVSPYPDKTRVTKVTSLAESFHALGDVIAAKENRDKDGYKGNQFVLAIPEDLAGDLLALAIRADLEPGQIHAPDTEYSSWKDLFTNFRQIHSDEIGDVFQPFPHEEADDIIEEVKQVQSEIDSQLDRQTETDQDDATDPRSFVR